MDKASVFWKKFFTSSSVTVFNAIKAIVINKLLAVYLPPSLFACVGQFINFMTMTQATSSMAMQNGWVSLTSQHLKNKNELFGIWRGGIRLTTFATIFTCVVAVIFCFVAPLESLLPGIPLRLAQASILFSLPGIFAMNIISICASVMNGLGKMREWMVIQIVASLWQVVWVSFFLYTGKLSVLSIIATQSIFAGIFAIQYASRAGFSLKILKNSNLDIRKPWVSYAMMGIIPMLLSPIVISIIRYMIGNSMGWNAAGVWQGICKISDFFASIFTVVLGVILLPKISKSMTKYEFKKFFKSIFIRLVLITFFIISIIFIFRQTIVSLFFSSSFMGIAYYMHYQLLGDLFKSAGWCFGFVLIARSETKLFLGIEIFAQLLYMFGTFVGIRLFEFNGPMIAYAFENFITLIILFFIVRNLKWNIQ